MAKFYIAGSTSSINEVRQIRDLVIANEHQVTFDWTLSSAEGGEGEIRTTWNEESQRAEALSCRERAAVEDADILILSITNFIGGPGRWIEYGMAAARKIPIWVVNRYLYPEGRDSVFFYLPEVVLIPGLPDLVNLLLDKKMEEIYG